MKERSVDLTFAAELTTPVSAEQLLYRTTNELGQPALAVTTVIKSLAAGVAPTKIVSWQTAYDATGPNCDPSYEFQGGSAGLSSDYLSGCDGLDQAEITGASSFLTQGAAVVIPDYEETNEAWAAGPLEGYATLDSLRAAETYLGAAPASTPIGLIGYSGGAIPSQWAAELAPAYAPSLDIVGTAAGGVLVDPVHNMVYVSNDGSIDWSNVMPAVLLTIFGRAFGMPIYSYASAYGQQLMTEDSNAYIADLAGGNMTYQQLLAPAYQDITAIPEFAEDFNDLIMGSDGTPRSPMYLANGSGTDNNGYDGDGVMITADVEGLAHEYCTRGVSVEYQQFSGLDHEEALVAFEPQAISYITERLSGAPAPSNCSSTGIGASLAPLPVPASSSSASAKGATPVRPTIANTAVRTVRRRGRVVLSLSRDRKLDVDGVRVGTSTSHLRAAQGWRAFRENGDTWDIRRTASVVQVAIAWRGEVGEIGLLSRSSWGTGARERRVLRGLAES